MELLITLIGNAAVDPVFRKHFLDDPVDTADEYGFRLTKGEFEMMKAVFADLTQKEKEILDQTFLALENVLYNNLSTRTPKPDLPSQPCHPPCMWSIFPPPEPHELRKERETAEKARKLVKAGKAA